MDNKHGETVPSRFSFDTGQDIIQPCPQDRRDSMYSNYKYNEEEDDGRYSADIKKEFGSSKSKERLRSGTMRRDSSPMSIFSSEQWAGMYRTSRDNPFEDPHPCRGQEWTLTEDSLNGFGPAPKRYSDASPSEVLRVLGFPANISGKKNHGRLDGDVQERRGACDFPQDTICEQPKHQSLFSLIGHNARLPTEDSQASDEALVNRNQAQTRLRCERRKIGELACFASHTDITNISLFTPPSIEQETMDSTNELAKPPPGGDQARPESMAPDNASTTAPGPMSTVQETSTETEALAKDSDTPQPTVDSSSEFKPHSTFAHARSALQLPERIKSLESRAKSVGQWDKIYEETSDPKLSDPGYRAFLVNPERAKGPLDAFNEQYDALIEHNYTKMGNGGKVVRTLRPELPPKYLSRPSKRVSLPVIPSDFPDKNWATSSRGVGADKNGDDDNGNLTDSVSDYLGLAGLTMEDQLDQERVWRSTGTQEAAEYTASETKGQPGAATEDIVSDPKGQPEEDTEALGGTAAEAPTFPPWEDMMDGPKDELPLTLFLHDHARRTSCQLATGTWTDEYFEAPKGEGYFHSYNLLFNPHRYYSPCLREAASGEEAVQPPDEASQKDEEEKMPQQTLETIRRNKGVYPGHDGLAEEDQVVSVHHQSEAERLAREKGERRESQERVVVGHLCASEMHDMREQAEAAAAAKVPLPESPVHEHEPEDGLSDALLEVRQTVKVLQRSQAAPFQPPPPLPPPPLNTSPPPPPTIQVIAATLRPGEINNVDDTGRPQQPGPQDQDQDQDQHQDQHQPQPQHQRKDSQSFLGDRLASLYIKIPTLDMDRLQVRSTELSSVKAKAIEDARQMQAHVIEECTKAGKDPPPYGLVELIGKGSFGRVYMGKDMKSAAIVAVKIIDIDESDTLNPRTADSYSEFLKEVNALKILSENKAKNINHVIEALPVNQAMWMITEHCGGGSVATLMKPSAPSGLMEKWIIPILREVAEALKWVHQAGIIHRDIKCANVLITEQGGVQLCDFGVAGIIENKLDKRSTIIGTPHWMAPELFSDTPSYGKEVDIWAFGAMTFEIATGLPPNVANGIPYERLGSHLKKNVPRLEGGDYSNELRNMVAYLLEEDPSARPTIEQVQKHKYIANTSSTYPTTNLRSLVGSFRVWESRGGDRKSLFMQHGAQGPSYASSGQDEWNFSTTEVFDQKVMEEFSAQDVFDAYGPSINFDEATARPRQTPKGSRRRPPPEALARMPAPLEKIFDPNTMTNYEDNSRVHYGKGMASAPSTSDLPLRDDSAQTSIKDTMIDLGGHDTETGISSFSDMDTIKAGRRQDENEDQYNSTLPDFSRPALSDPADINTNRRTQDWKFPSMAPPASADPEISYFPPTSYELPRPAVTPGSGGRPTLVHHPTEPLGAFGGGLLGPTTTAMGRMSMRESLIDLDMSLPDSIPEIRRPSTANSDVSATSEQMTSGNPFELERHASLYQPVAEQGSDPAVYISEESSVPTRLRTGNSLQDIADMSDFSASDVEGPLANGRARRIPQYDGVDDSDYQAMPPPPLPSQTDSHISGSGQPYTMAHFPSLPPHPSIAALTGIASNTEMEDELRRALAGLNGQLSAFKDVYSGIESTPRRGSTIARRENSQD